jgi:hypothetical protein
MKEGEIKEKWEDPVSSKSEGTGMMLAEEVIRLASWRWTGVELTLSRR